LCVAWGSCERSAGMVSSMIDPNVSRRAKKVEDVTAYISGVAYVLVGYTIRLVVYCVVYTAVYVYVVALVLDDRAERFFNSEKRWPATSLVEKGDDPWLTAEKSDDTRLPSLLTERVRQ
jgi:hypothetical protein